MKGINCSNAGHHYVTGVDWWLLSELEEGCDFEPSPSVPALQFFEGVDMNGMAIKADLRPGDFLLEVSRGTFLSTSQLGMASSVESRHRMATEAPTAELADTEQGSSYRNYHSIVI